MIKFKILGFTKIYSDDGDFEDFIFRHEMNGSFIEEPSIVSFVRCFNCEVNVFSSLYGDLSNKFTAENPKYPPLNLHLRREHYNRCQPI